MSTSNNPTADTLTTSDVCRRLGVVVTIDHLTALGLPPTQRNTPGAPGARWPVGMLPVIAAHLAADICRRAGIDLQRPSLAELADAILPIPAAPVGERIPAAVSVPTPSEYGPYGPSSMYRTVYTGARASDRPVTAAPPAADVSVSLGDGCSCRRSAAVAP